MVIDEARGNDALFLANCDNVYFFSRTCSNLAGPRLAVTIGGVEAGVAATRTGDVLFIGSPFSLIQAFKSPQPTDPVNLSTRAVLVALRAHRFEIRRVRAAVQSRVGPVYGYIVELDRDAFSLLEERAAAAAREKDRS